MGGMEGNLKRKLQDIVVWSALVMKKKPSDEEHGNES